MKRCEILIVSGITILAAILRIAFLVALKSNWPGWGSPTIDALYHHIWALQIAGGDILGGGPYFRAPLYPILLGLQYAIFGVNFTAVTLIQHLIGITAIPLTYIIAKRFFNPTIAYIAAGLVSINGILIYFESQLLLDFLCVVLMLLLILTLEYSYRKKKLIVFILPGIVTGLYAITRPNILAVIPLIIFWLFMLEFDYKTKVKTSIMFLLGVLLFVVPITVRNIAVGDDFVIVASQGGVNFYIGNNEQADGYTALLPGFGHTWQYSDAEYETAGALGVKPDKVKPSQVSSYYFDKSFKYIIKHPGHFIKLIIKKLYMFWNYFEISNNNNLYFLTGYIGISFIPMFLFVIISPLGLVGTILCFFKERRYWIFPLIIFGYMATIVAFFVTGRFRIPLIPLLTIMSSYTIHEIYLAIKRANIKRAVAIGVSVLLVGIISWTNFYDHHDKSMAMAHYSLGNMLMRKANYDGAKAEYLTAIKDVDCVPNACLNLGVIAFYQKDSDLARSYFNDEISNCGPNAKAYNNLSLLSRLAHDNDSSIAWADSAIKYYPNFKEAYINRILASYATSDSSRIETAVKEFIYMFPDNPAALYYYGMLKYDQDDINTAQGYFKEVVTGGLLDIVSEYDLSEIYSSSLPYGYNRERTIGKSYYQLGLIAAQKGNIEDAYANFQNAVRLMPEDSDALANLALACDQSGDFENAIEHFKHALAIDSSNAVYYYNYAMTLGKTGDLQNALINLEKAVELKPDFTQAKTIIEALKTRLK